jgi:uncharacterized cofD-like protein
MRSFFEWFKASTKVKRWIVLILIGVVLTCYAFMKIFTTSEMEFIDVARVIGLFVLGFVCIVLGIIFIQRRNLELIIEANNSDEMSKKNVNIKSLIFNKKVYEEGPKILVIGGGKGLNTVIEGLKKYTNNITSIVTMADYGVNPSKSREELDILPLEDIKDSIIAMSDHEEIMSKLMNLTFKNDRLKNLNFGDIYLTAMNEIYDNVPEAIRKSTEVLNITGRVLPVTLDEIKICAELNDGTTIEQKNKIPEIVAERVETINRIYISPSNANPAPGVLEAIKEAEAIIIGPGSLYTNVIPNLLVKGVAKAIKESKAIKVYISNIMTEPGQTDNYTVADHIETIQEHVGTGVFDIVLADSGEIVPEFVRKYNQEGSEIVDLNKSKASALGVKVLERKVSCIKDGEIRHNPDAIASIIIELICNELKFQDKQGQTEYLLLNSVMRQQNKIQAKRDRIARKEKRRVDKGKAPRTKTKKKSKFSEKYKERVESIQTSETRAEENKKAADKLEKMQSKLKNSKNVKTKNRRAQK